MGGAEITIFSSWNNELTVLSHLKFSITSKKNGA
jgi:hypothetical protein